MKRTELIWATFVTMIVVACLISVPALSGENPWDADGGNNDGGTGSPLDSTLLDAGWLNSNVQASTSEVPTGGGSDREPSIFTRVSVRVSSFIISYFQKGILKKAPNDRYAY